MTERDTSQDTAATQDAESKLAGPRGSTAAAYETARQNQAAAEGIIPEKPTGHEPNSDTREAAENARTMNEGQQGDSGRKATLEDERDAADVQGYRRQDVDGKIFPR